MRSLFCLLLLFLQAPHAWSTPQFPDKIIYGGKAYNLNSNPLEPYFQIYPDRRPKGGTISTALWRGYVATFEIVDSQLVVKDIQIQSFQDSAGHSYRRWKSVMLEVFPGQTNVPLKWWSGLLVLPHGKLINYVHMGYGSTYKKYILLAIDKGHFTTEKRFNHKAYEKFKDRQFQVFKGTQDYRDLVEKLKKEGSSQEFIDLFLKDFVTSYTSKFLAE